MSINRGADKEDMVCIHNGILLSHKKKEIVPLIATWLLSVGFSRQEYWSEFPFISPGDRPDPRIKIEPASLVSPALAGEFFTS